MKFKKNYLILGSLLSASIIPMVAMSCATTKTDDKKPMEVKEDKQKPGTSASTPTTPSADKPGTDKANTSASTATPTDKSGSGATDTSNQAGKTDTSTSTDASGSGKAEGDTGAGKSTTETDTAGSAGTNQPATPPSTGQGDSGASGTTVSS